MVFGVLTTENLEQAMERSEVGGADKGAEAAVTAVEMVKLLQRVTGGGPLSRH